MIEPHEYAEQASNIQAMMQSPGWQFYVAVIMDKIVMTHEAALADEPAQLLYHRGSVDGMKAAILSAKDCLNIAHEFRSSEDRTNAKRLMPRREEGESTL